MTHFTLHTLYCSCKTILICAALIIPHPERMLLLGWMLLSTHSAICHSEQTLALSRTLTPSCFRPRSSSFSAKLDLVARVTKVDAASLNCTNGILHITGSLNIVCLQSNQETLVYSFKALLICWVATDSFGMVWNLRESCCWWQWGRRC